MVPLQLASQTRIARSPEADALASVLKRSSALRHRIPKPSVTPSSDLLKSCSRRLHDLIHLKKLEVPCLHFFSKLVFFWFFVLFVIYFRRLDARFVSFSVRSRKLGLLLFPPHDVKNCLSPTLGSHSLMGFQGEACPGCCTTSRAKSQICSSGKYLHFTTATTSTRASCWHGTAIQCSPSRNFTTKEPKACTPQASSQSTTQRKAVRIYQRLIIDQGR